MKLKYLVVLFVIRWTTQEAVENRDAVFHIQGCHIEYVKHEEKFEREIQARGAMASMETNGLKPELFRVEEKAIK